MSHVLHVSTGSEAVGTLSFDAHENRYGFEYARSWESRRGAYSLSPPIPLNGPPDSPGSVQRFLENLLPEGRALDIVSAHNHVSKNNIFALVHALGAEPVGAFSFLAMDATSEEAARAAHEQVGAPGRRPITDEELSERIRLRDAVPFPVWDGRTPLCQCREPKLSESKKSPLRQWRSFPHQYDGNASLVPQKPLAPAHRTLWRICVVPREKNRRSCRLE